MSSIASILVDTVDAVPDAKTLHPPYYSFCYGTIALLERTKSDHGHWDWTHVVPQMMAVPYLQKHIGKV